MKTRIEHFGLQKGVYKLQIAPCKTYVEPSQKALEVVKPAKFFLGSVGSLEKNKEEKNRWKTIRLDVDLYDFLIKYDDRKEIKKSYQFVYRVFESTLLSRRLEGMIEYTPYLLFETCNNKHSHLAATVFYYHDKFYPYEFHHFKFIRGFFDMECAQAWLFNWFKIFVDLMKVRV